MNTKFRRSMSILSLKSAVASTVGSSLALREGLDVLTKSQAAEILSLKLALGSPMPTVPQNTDIANYFVKDLEAVSLVKIEFLTVSPSATSKGSPNVVRLSPERMRKSGRSRHSRHTRRSNSAEGART